MNDENTTEVYRIGGGGSAGLQLALMREGVLVHSHGIGAGGGGCLQFAVNVDQELPKL